MPKPRKTRKAKKPRAPRIEGTSSGFTAVKSTAVGTPDDYESAFNLVIQRWCIMAQVRGLLIHETRIPTIKFTRVKSIRILGSTIAMPRTSSTWHDAVVAWALWCTAWRRGASWLKLVVCPFLTDTRDSDRVCRQILALTNRETAADLYIEFDMTPDEFPLLTLLLASMLVDNPTDNVVIVAGQ